MKQDWQTNMASDGMQESILRRLAGWTGGSDMPAVYIHVGNKDVEQAQCMARLLLRGVYLRVL